MRARTLVQSRLNTLALGLSMIVVLGFAAGCTRTTPDLRIQVSGNLNPWTDLNIHDDLDSFQFAIVSDLTAGLRPGVFESTVEKLNLLRPDFVMSVGDFIEGLTTDDATIARQWEEFDGWVKKLRMPFFYVPGNHDISNPVMAKKWKQRYGRSYYHFVYRNVLFLCLDTDDPPSCSISDQQLDYFRRVLSANRSVRWTFVFMHRPTWLPDYSNRTPTNGEKFETLLAGRPHTVFAGHDHKYSKAIRQGRCCYVLSTTGAQGRGTDFTTSRGNRSKALLGLDKGEFDHVVWVTMSDNGPVIANLLLNGILDDEPVSNPDGKAAKTSPSP